VAIEMEGEKTKKQRQQITKVQYLTSMNVIDITIDESLGVGCKSEGHVNVQFQKLYVLLCLKTLKCDYFKKSLMTNLLMRMK